MRTDLAILNYIKVNGQPFTAVSIAPPSFHRKLRPVTKRAFSCRFPSSRT